MAVNVVSESETVSVDEQHYLWVSCSEGDIVAIHAKFLLN